MVMREQLERLIDEMVTKGVRYDDAQREFEKRFITCVVQQSAGNLSRAADTLGVHRNTLTRKIKELKIRAR
jgi:DNA-binding NtrC family response regulator